MKKNAVFLTALLVGAMAWGKPIEPKNSVASLRSAIKHIMTTCGEAYPDGAAYLARLDNITDSSSAEYKQLQREALLSHPHIKGYDWLVEVRNQYWGNHGPINTMFQNGDINRSGSGGLKNWLSRGSRFDKIAINKDGRVTRTSSFAEQPEGIVRDAVVRFDGKKILYSMRRNKADDYHLYEMDVDGGNVQQLTFGRMLSDVDPVYLPSGKILFSSTRDSKYCQCNRNISLNQFVMDADGANILQISRNNLADFHSSLMPDGRIMYSRWEYVDRHFGPSLGLWTVNPDGTRHALFMGNNAWSPGSMVDARAIPGTDQVLCIYGATHDLPWGAMAVVDRSKGMEGTAPVLHMWPESARELVTPDDDPRNYSTDHRRMYDRFRKLKARYEDPYPVHNLARGDGGGAFFMVAKALRGPFDSYGNRKGKPVDMAIVLADVFGNELVVYQLNESGRGAYGPIPLAARKTPPAIPDAVDLAQESGTLYVNDVYLGDKEEMSAVKRGTVKYLRIIEAPPRRTYDERGGWDIDAAQVGAMNWNLTNNKKILGDVPVEADGSAYFKVPADTFFQIHALDENKQMIQAMRSGTMVRPGETQGCIGCHENRLSAPVVTNPMPLAMKRAPSELEPWLDTPSVAESKPFNYLTDVQPVFDAHCVSCHDYGKKAGKALNLSGDLSLPFNVSYTELMSKSGARYTGPEEKLVNFVGDGPPGVLPAYAWGSRRSKLVRVLQEGHKNVKLSDDEMARIISWIDINAVYYGRYESWYPGRNPLLALEDGAKKEKMVVGKLTGKKISAALIENGHLVNFTRPEKSPVLSQIEDPAQRAKALEYLKESSALLQQRPRVDQTNSDQPYSEMDVHNAARDRSLQNENMKSEDAVLSGRKYYQFK